MNKHFRNKLFILITLLPFLSSFYYPDETLSDYNASVKSVGFISDKTGIIASGFFINRNTFITNYHVTKDLDINSAEIEMKNGTTFSVTKIIKEYGKTDLAVIRTDDFSDHSLKLEADTMPEVNDEVFSIGNPTDDKDHVDYFKITKGRIKKILYDEWHYDNEDKDRHEAQVIRHTAVIKPGNSGGPLVNKSGLVIGINTYFYNDSLNYAVHVSELINILNKNGIPFNEASGKKDIKEIKKTRSLKERFHYVMSRQEYLIKNYYLVLISGILLYYMLVMLAIISLLTYILIKGNKKRTAGI